MMKFRKLQIAWSVLCGIFFLLLIALWMRSYWRYDYLGGHISSTKSFAVHSSRGRLVVQDGDLDGVTPWTTRTYSIDEDLSAFFSESENRFGFGFIDTSHA